ncbi:putative proline-rich receptor-like protein kinase PERK6 [Lycium barbarum]|uniref:putative proline-rich receptor-like protein kinase PERK6 n=1 Tax=Lycium barbarum TaxID=112863 RepID=UPI00293EBA35|nr:putative proline-rich receptor-like protein kinase PERK6 [Lycium barbarum]
MSSSKSKESPPSSSSSSSHNNSSLSSLSKDSNSQSSSSNEGSSPSGDSTNSSNDNNDNNNNNNNNNDNNNNDNNKSQPSPKSSNSSKGGSQSSPPPPPPPPDSHSRHKSPPLPKHSSHDSDSSDNNNHDKTLLIGIGVAAGLLFLLSLVCLISWCKKKRRRPRDHMGLYMDNSYRAKRDDYYNNEKQGNWNKNVQSTEHVVKIPPPTNSAGVSSEYNWPIAPPSPPPPMSNSSSRNFSGTQHSTTRSANFSGTQHQQRQQKNPNPRPPNPSNISFGFNQSSLTYDDLATATGGFSKANLLGQGGFGVVHKGVLPNGKEVAVKSLKSNSGQGEREFQAEVETISRVNHRHLVSLVGYCISGSQRMLVYEFIPNNTLEYHLHGPGNPVMDFPTRLKIAIGAAKGFAYIHEDCHPRIIHRDIKGANILLDNNFEAKVADFGLAKLAADNFTHVSTRIMGTFGYLAPEYASTGKLTEKSDVYSYGIMLLELITGRRPIDLNSDGDNLVDWARPILDRATEGGNYDELIDPRLEEKFDGQQMLCMVICAAASIKHSAKRRPKMSQIVRTLEGDVSLLDDLNKGSTPGHSGIPGSGESSECEGGSYGIKLKKSEISSDEFTGSEHGSTGEFVHSK